MTPEECKTLAVTIVKHLPPEVLADMVEQAINRSLHSLAWATDEISKITHAAVIERAKELLKTQYAEQVTAQAQLLAAQMVGELSRMKLQEPRR